MGQLIFLIILFSFTNLCFADMGGGLTKTGGDAIYIRQDGTKAFTGTLAGALTVSGDILAESLRSNTDTTVDDSLYVSAGSSASFLECQGTTTAADIRSKTDNDLDITAQGTGDIDFITDADTNVKLSGTGSLDLGELNIIKVSDISLGTISASGDEIIFQNSISFGDNDITNIGEIDLDLLRPDAAAGQVKFYQSSATGTEYIGLNPTGPFWFKSDVDGTTSDEREEATVVISAVDSNAYGLYVKEGKVEFLRNLTSRAQFDVYGNFRIFDDSLQQLGTGGDAKWKWIHRGEEGGGLPKDLLWLKILPSSSNEPVIVFNTTGNVDGLSNDFDSFAALSMVFLNEEGADAEDWSGIFFGPWVSTDVSVTNYFDFTAKTGSLDNAVDATTTELAPVFRFGPNGSAAPDNATTGGDVFLEGQFEVDGTIYIDGKYVLKVDSRTIASTGDANPATLTLEPTTSYVELDCDDTDTCDITMSETNAEKGQVLKIIGGAGTETCDFADTANVLALAGNVAFAMNPRDVLQLTYRGTIWVEDFRSDN